MKYATHITLALFMALNVSSMGEPSTEKTMFKAPASWTKLNDDTRQNCNEIGRFISEHYSNKGTLSSGDERLDSQWKIPDREACRISLKGVYTENVPDIDVFFNGNGWEPLNEYMADGACGGMLGYFKGATFCMRSIDTNCNGVVDAPPPTQEFEIQVTCTRAFKRNVIE